MNPFQDSGQVRWRCCLVEVNFSPAFFNRHRVEVSGRERAEPIAVTQRAVDGGLHLLVEGEAERALVKTARALANTKREQARTLAQHSV